jgi:alpha-maltose-1-phosphate synthase
VVATRVGGLPGLVEDEGTGLLVPPDDVPALAGAIVRLLETPGLAARMGARGRARALAEFGLDRMSERVDTFYCRALGPSEGTPAPREAAQRA